jgi:hypothetical protein
MRHFALSVAICAAQPAIADPALLDFMGAHGCTFGADSRKAAESVGFGAATIDALVATALTNGTASQQGDYVVLDATVCTIRLPDIQSAYTVASPEILAITSAIDAYASDGQPGCFALDAASAFDALRGGERGAGFFDFIHFVGAGLILGDLRFYAPTPLATPVSFQVLTSDCAKVPNIEAIRRSHAFIASGFGDYIRALGAEMPCNAAGFGANASAFAARIQGADPDLASEDQSEINAWLFFEYEIIAMAAGWHQGLTGTEKGEPRPPLCHYP